MVIKILRKKEKSVTVMIHLQESLKRIYKNIKTNNDGKE